MPTAPCSARRSLAASSASYSGCMPTPRRRRSRPMRRGTVVAGCVALLGIVATRAAAQQARTWTVDNGNGTFTNPIFYDEFSDPDLIRVGEDYYLTGTTMHAMPGLPVLHSRDLVNWELMSYASDRLDLGPSYRLEGGDI